MGWSWYDRVSPHLDRWLPVVISASHTAVMITALIRGDLQKAAVGAMLGAIWLFIVLNRLKRKKLL